MNERRASSWSFTRLAISQLSAALLLGLNSSALVQGWWCALETAKTELGSPIDLRGAVARNLFGVEVELIVVAAFTCVLLHYAFAGPHCVTRLRLARCSMILILVFCAIGIANWSAGAGVYVHVPFSGLLGFVLVMFTVTTWHYGGHNRGSLAGTLSVVFLLATLAFEPLSVLRSTVFSACLGLVSVSLLLNTPAHEQFTRCLVEGFDAATMLLRRVSVLSRVRLHPHGAVKRS
jgi:hypothetical protein